MNKSKMILWSAVADTASIVIFVAIGRKNHDEGQAASGIFRVAAPFLLALLVGWVIARAWKEPLSQRSGVLISLTTIVLGMVLRKLVFDNGTATAFIIVATIFLGTLLNGWRLLARTRLARSN
jgi:predicted permease